MRRRDGTAERREQLYREALAIIGRDYARDLRVEGVARTVAASRRQLQRVFAEANTSFREVLQEARMREARRLLEREDIRIGEVARRVGYRTQAQFAKAFRRACGMPPRDFRRSLMRRRTAVESARQRLWYGLLQLDARFPSTSASFHQP